MKYAIMRFQKHKSSAVGGIEAHNERTKSEYKSNPDIDLSKSKDNYNLVGLHCGYRDAINTLLKIHKCRTRKDSVVLVETVVTASNEFFKKKSKKEIREFFEHALDFYKKHLTEGTIISAAVHLDETTPHMHLCFVPITKDHRLSAKEIVGNKQKLTYWQDMYHAWMSKKYPELERGTSSQITGRTYIPTQLYKRAKNLNKQAEKIVDAIERIGVLNMKQGKTDAEDLIKKYMEDRANLLSKLAVYAETMRQMREENADLKKKSRISVNERLEMGKRKQEYEQLKSLVSNIPPEILRMYSAMSRESKPHSLER